MKRPAVVWYVGLALLAAAPLCVRAYTWWAHRPQPVDPVQAQAGGVLFRHEWKPNDPLAGGDGLGPVYNAKSCVACHFQAGPGGGGGVGNNVTTFTVRQANGPLRSGVLHAFATRFLETLADIDSSLPRISRPALAMLVPAESRHSKLIELPDGVHLSQRNTPALFGAKLIDDIPERTILANERATRLKWGMTPASVDNMPVGRASRLPDGRIGKFGWKGQSAGLADFVQAACANELGLGNPGQPQPQPLGRPNYQPPGVDLTQEQCDQLTAFVASLPRPVERIPERPAECERAAAGKKLFHAIGCADCHTPDVGPVPGIYSDLLLHRMGEILVGSGSYNEPPRPHKPAVPEPETEPSDEPRPDEWRTPPLWGVADSAPYLHDGRAATLEDAIRLHAGQAARSARHFKDLGPEEQGQLVAFLQTLRAP
jgi:CxxC motif-containing protein (DUF1111 family)